MAVKEWMSKIDGPKLRWADGPEGGSRAERQRTRDAGGNKSKSSQGCACQMGLHWQGMSEVHVPHPPDCYIIYKCIRRYMNLVNANLEIRNLGEDEVRRGVGGVEGRSYPNTTNAQHHEWMTEATRPLCPPGGIPMLDLLYLSIFLPSPPNRISTRLHARTLTRLLLIVAERLKPRWFWFTCVPHRHRHRSLSLSSPFRKITFKCSSANLTFSECMSCFYYFLRRNNQRAKRGVKSSLAACGTLHRRGSPHSSIHSNAFVCEWLQAIMPGMTPLFFICVYIYIVGDLSFLLIFGHSKKSMIISWRAKSTTVVAVGSTRPNCLVTWVGWEKKERKKRYMRPVILRPLKST